MQALRSANAGREGNLYEEISITPYEAAAGARKMINIPWGFYNRFFKVTIPPGAKDGMILRLKGAGRQVQDGQEGDLFLKIRIQQPW